MCVYLVCMCVMCGVCVCVMYVSVCLCAFVCNVIALPVWLHVFVCGIFVCAVCLCIVPSVLV